MEQAEELGGVLTKLERLRKAVWIGRRVQHVARTRAALPHMLFAGKLVEANL